MIEVKICTLMNKLNNRTKEFALASLNRRSIKAIDKFNDLSDFISDSKHFLAKYEDQIELQYQKEDKEINAAWKRISAL